jgi:type III pantothenate kinase
MLATFDISNTRVTVGFFDGEDLRASFSMVSDPRRTSDEYGLLVSGFLREQGIPSNVVRGAAIASVVPPLTGAFEQLCARLLKVRPIVVGIATRTGIRIATQHPRELGPDRIVNAIAVQRLQGSPAIVVDLDTATAFDVVAADGSYAGAIIAPGLATSAEALFQHASRLQRVELARPRLVIGRDTVSSLQAGVVLGHVALVEGLVARIRAELGQSAPVVATGELAPLIAAETSVIDRVEPWLSLIGLRLFHQLNEST